jgi:gliding motility-associated-like protein
MKRRFRNIITISLVLLPLVSYSQKDCTVPVSPVLNSVSVQPETGYAELNWSLSPSSDVAAYILYNHNSGYWITIDTLWDPAATSYLYASAGTKYFSESYVVAAFRKPICTSPLSNIISTIFCSASIDTCKKQIIVRWNKYPDFPKKVLDYQILVSKNGSTLTVMITVDSLSDSYVLTDFEMDAKYCFAVRAELEGGSTSSSNKNCLETKMQRPPQWINADYATVNSGNEILLSFKIDPSSEIKIFKLEKKTGSQGTFQEIYRSSSVSGSMLFNDSNADISKINYYRLSALNNCNTAVTWSNIASNIVLFLERNNDDIKLIWNPYKEWLGSVGSYRLFANTGGVFSEKSVLTPSDTALNISYSDLMYEVTGKEVCFMVKAVEASNPFGDPGESSSRIVCTPISEVITVPNVFTPDNNGLNDLFWPFLSFTPTSYQLVVTDLQRKTVFESKNPAEKWDGTRNGNPLPEGVYLWYLKAVTPSGKSISRTGNITIIINH